MPTEFFYNATEPFGQLIIAATQNTTGSEFLTLLGMVVLFIGLCALFRLPLEFSAILVFPLLIAAMAFTGEMWSVGGVFAIYIGFMFAKNFIIK